MGLKLRGNLLALRSGSNDAAKFVAFINKIKSSTDYPFILISRSADVLTAGVKACAERKPLIFAATKETIEQIGALAKETGCPVAAKAANPEEMAVLTEKLAAMGILVNTFSRSYGKLYAAPVILEISGSDLLSANIVP